jgi:hypothetical protein
VLAKLCPELSCYDIDELHRSRVLARNRSLGTAGLINQEPNCPQQKFESFAILSLWRSSGTSLSAWGTGAIEIILSGHFHVTHGGVDLLFKSGL